MTDLIDRQAALKAVFWDEDAQKNIEVLPAIDAVPVVRCKDCYRAKEDKLYGGLWCGGHIRHAQWFCADAERRTDERPN